MKANQFFQYFHKTVVGTEPSIIKLVGLVDIQLKGYSISMTIPTVHTKMAAAAKQQQGVTMRVCDLLIDMHFLWCRLL